MLLFFDKMLINAVDMNIKLTRGTETFCLLAPLEDNLRIKILDATLLLLKSNWKPLVFLLMLMSWEWNVKHIILLHYSDQNSYSDFGSQQVSIDNAFIGLFPERILIALV